MPHTNMASAPVGVDIPEFEGRYVDLDGYTVGFETYKADVDPAGFFRGLPDDRCQCPRSLALPRYRACVRRDHCRSSLSRGVSMWVAAAVVRCPASSVAYWPSRPPLTPRALLGG